MTLRNLSADAGTGENPNSRFLARNFLLDENVTVHRARTYESKVGSLAGVSCEVWRGQHKGYLDEHVNRGNSEPYHLSAPFDPGDLECPDTFRDPNLYAQYGALDGQVRLLHCVKLDFIRTKIGADVGSTDALVRIADLAARAGPLGAGDPDAVQQLDEELATWHPKLDRRPAFITYLHHVADLFGDKPVHDVTGWADDLRDRLGLANYEPGTEFILFSYLVGELCYISTDPQQHPLALPTVVDQPLSCAFCPAPRNSNGCNLRIALGCAV